VQRVSDIGPEDRDNIIRTVIGEVDPHDTEDGRAAVAHVIMNRVKAGTYGGTTPTDVVHKRGQFEPWATRSRELLSYDPASPEYKQTGAIVDDVLSGKLPDPTNGATHFLNRDIVARRAGGIEKIAPWANNSPPLAQIGHHTFYAPDGKPAAFAAKDEADDPLARFVNPPHARITVRPERPAGTAAPAEDDPLGTWAASHPAPQTKPAPAAVAPAANQPQPNISTQSQDLARWVGDAHGNGAIDPETGAKKDSWGDTAVQLGGGALKGIDDVAGTIAQGIGAVGDYGARGLSKLGIISPESVGAVQDWRSKVNNTVAAENQLFDKAAGNSLAPAIGRVGGQIVGTGPLIAGMGAAAGTTRAVPLIDAAAARIATHPVISSALRGAGVGGASTALTSSASDEPLLDQMKTGAGVGAVLGPVGHGIAKTGSKLFGAGIDQETAQLARTARNKYDIPVTAGQISANPTVRFLDSVLQRLPFTGYGARTAAQQTALNRAVGNEMGVQTDKITPTVIHKTLKDLGKQYNALNAKIGPLQIDQKFVHDLQDIRTNVSYSLEQSKADVVQKHIENILSKVDRHSLSLDPANAQYLMRHGGPLDKAIGSADSGVKHFAGDVKTAVEDLIERNDPALGAERKSLNYKYFVTKSMQPLAEESAIGDISPAKLLKAADNSSADIGELGRIGKRFLKEPASSGTAERLMLMQHLPQLGAGVLGIGGLGAATYFDPESLQRNALLAAATIGVGRGASSALRSKLLTNAMINAGGRGGPTASGGKLFHLAAPAGALVTRAAVAPDRP